MELPLRQRSAGSTRLLDTCTSAKSLNETIATWLYIACASLKLLRHVKQSSDCGENVLCMKFCTPCEYVALFLRALMGKRGGWRWGRKRHDLPMDSFADAINSSSLSVNLPEGFADGHFRRCQRKLSAKIFNPVFLHGSISKTGCFTDNLKTSVKLPISVGDPECLRNVHKLSDVYHGKDRNSMLCIHYTPHPRLRKGEELE